MADKDGGIADSHMGTKCTRVRQFVMLSQTDLQDTALHPTGASQLVTSVTRLLTECIYLTTRMHSSRMRTARSSSRPGGSPPGTPHRAGTPPLGAGTPWTRHPPLWTNTRL